MVDSSNTWTLVSLMPELQVVRFTQPSLCELTDRGLFDQMLDDLLVRTGKGGVVVLNFQQVVAFDSCFLASLIRAYKRYEKLGAKFVACHLCDDVRMVLMVAGNKQPLDYMLNYVDNEEQAVAKAKKLLRTVDDGSGAQTDGK